MEVKLRSSIPGCIYWPCTIVTLGLFPLLVRGAEGHFPRTVDDEGITTRSGKRYAWSDFTRVERVKVRVEGIQASDEYLLYSKKGKVSLHLGRMIDAQQVVDYAFQRLPKSLLQG